MRSPVAPLKPPHRPAALEPGQVLAQPLVDPVKGHSLLAAGSVLTPIIIDKILRLGLSEEALLCVRQGKEDLPPRDPGLRQEAETLETRLYEGVEDLFSAPLPEEPFQEAWTLLQGLVPRVQGLAPVHRRDFRVQGGGTLLHPLNVMLLALQLGSAMRLPRADLLSLAQASLLHDIGKRRLGKERYKAGALSSYERRLLERHVEYGLDLLDRYRDHFPPLSPAARAGILSHHERWDGQGYSQGLKGEQIPVIARIIAIADAYDTMITDQVYRKRLLPEVAYHEILSLSGLAYDPEIVRVFKRAIAPYPVDSLLRLDSGDVARVVQLQEDLCRPIVRIPRHSRPIDLGERGAPAITRALYPRRFPRIPRVYPARLRIPGEHGAFPACTLNLSLGGACVALDAPVSAGTMLTMTLILPGRPSLELPGLVVWATEARGKTCLGLSFHPVLGSARDRMDAIF